MVTPEELAAILKQHKRVAIVGGPRTGKSTLANSVKGVPVVRTDDSKHLPWAEQPHAIIERTPEGPVVVEGVQTARALRKGLSVDAIVVLETPHTPLTPGQKTMAKGHKTILEKALAMNPDVKVYR
jgi:hypothetical protein